MVETIEILNELESAGWNFPPEVWEQASDYEQEFIRNEFTGIRTLENYIRRLEFHGFVGMDRILDAGCGYGQWILAMSRLNTFVEGVDISESRLNGAKSLAKPMEFNNTNFHQSPIEKLSFPNEHFDGIFCYGVFMFTHMPTALREFYRVMRPSGKLYISANTIGWYLHLLMDVPWNRKNALKMIVKTIMGYKKGIVVREKWLKKQLKSAVFNILSFGNEGEASTNPNSGLKSMPFYQKNYYGRPSILELIAVK
ncbi:MAG: class I SAM-dependent methyltransferase [Ekhidna sp.]|nr:class I SAM-dependent methyltransferase [Ekhidna sp.]